MPIAAESAPQIPPSAERPTPGSAPTALSAPSGLASLAGLDADAGGLCIGGVCRLPGAAVRADEH
ncbi:MAG: hypothetical protein JSS74_04930 [Actinobacteria bacterium]|nr:hypothetical protein [Actinomycetota bacterium]